MSEYNLTLEDLKIGNKYHKQDNRDTIYTLTGNLTVVLESNRSAVIIRQGDRFKEIVKEEEFKEVICVMNNISGRVTFKDESSYRLPSDYTKQDYKIEDGKLFVRDMK